MPEIGLFARGVVLVDSKGIIQYIELVENVHNEPNYQKILEEINK